MQNKKCVNYWILWNKTLSFWNRLKYNNIHINSNKISVYVLQSRSGFIEFHCFYFQVLYYYWYIYQRVCRYQSGYQNTVYLGRTDNTMAKRKKYKRTNNYLQIYIYITYCITGSLLYYAKSITFKQPYGNIIYVWISNCVIFNFHISFISH